MSEWDLTNEIESGKKTFQLGKFYKHSEGTYIAIRTRCNSTQWNECFFVETTDDQLGLVPVDDVANGWEEVTEEEWNSQFFME